MNSVDELKKLLCESDDFISGEYISGKLGISRAAVWKLVKKLRGEGYVISSRTNKGYRLESQPDLLDAAKIKEAAGLSGIEVECLLTVDSTNNELKRRAISGANEGTIILAEHQSAGRGRFGRGFDSPDGKGVYMSILLKPGQISELSGLTCLSAVAVVNAVRELCGLEAGIKWTNDIIAENKKLCGILTELSAEGESGELRYAVVGIGINAAESTEDFPPELRETACSLYSLQGRFYSRNALAGAILKEFFRLYKLSKSGGKTGIMDEYRRNCLTIGKDVEFTLDGRSVHARAEAIEDDGALVLSLTDGNRHVLRFGEARITSNYKAGG